jgi:hypothetical protein
MMKKIIIFTVIAIVFLNTILVANALIKSHKAEERANRQYEMEQIEKLHNEAEEIKALQNASDQYEELQYKLMCQTIEENYDYYESFSKKCISEFEEDRDDEFYTMNGFFDLYTIIESELKEDFNNDLIKHDCYIVNEEGIIFVQLKYPVSIEMFDFSNGSTHLYSYDCTVIYIPDEYLNEESIATVYAGFRLPFENIKENLFVMRHPVMNY